MARKWLAISLLMIAVSTNAVETQKKKTGTAAKTTPPAANPPKQYEIPLVKPDFVDTNPFRTDAPTPNSNPKNPGDLFDAPIITPKKTTTSEPTPVPTKRQDTMETPSSTPTAAATESDTSENTDSESRHRGKANEDVTSSPSLTQSPADSSPKSSVDNGRIIQDDAADSRNSKKNEPAMAPNSNSGDSSGGSC